jgi:hypothetical protein
MENTYAVIVAIETYVSGGLSRVPYAEADATEFAKALEDSGVPSENITLLVNSNASADNVRYYLFNIIGGLKETDRFIFFYAGHGTRSEFDEQENYITTHGCRDDYLLEPSVKIKEIVAKLEESDCKNCCMFLDACHSELSANASIRAPLKKLSTDQLTEETENSEFLICFSSCGKSQKSHSSAKLKHGIWTYYLLRAFSGDVPSVLSGRAIISTKLQDYLHDSVTNRVKLEYGATKRQTPRMSGSLTRNFSILELPPLPLADEVDPISFNLFGVEEGELRYLSGWKSHYQNWGNEGFLCSAADQEMTGHKNAIFKQLRSALGLKTSEISVSDSGQGFLIETPECSVSAWIRYSSTHDDSYVIEFEISGVSDISVLDKIDSPPISKLIAGACEVQSNLDLKASIASLESADFLIDTDAEKTFFETEYEDPDFVVKGTEDRLILSCDSGLGLREIAEVSAEILGEIKPLLKFKDPMRFRKTRPL